MNASNGQVRANEVMRPTTGTSNYDYGAAYNSWAQRGCQGGMTMPGNQAYSGSAQNITARRQSGFTGVSAGNLNLANPNRQSDAIADQRVYDDDYAWMDSEEAPSMMPRVATDSSTRGLPTNSTSNATNAQGYTGAAVPGADQVEAPGNNLLPNAQSINQQPTEWRFYQTPLVDRMQAQQQLLPNGPYRNGDASVPGQQPSGVSEAASGGPIKY